VTTGENLRSSGPHGPRPWHVDVTEGGSFGDVLGVTPQICHDRWDRISPRSTHALARLRIDVLVVEAGSPHAELDADDLAAGTEHVWIADRDVAVAYLRAVQLEDGTRCVDRLCARRDVRALGLTGALVDDLVGRHGGDAIRALAAAECVPIFVQHGFEVCGPPTTLPAGPHTPMTRYSEAPWREAYRR